jgi:hypothetical protein
MTKLRMGSCVLSSLFFASAASAAHPQERQGFWIGLGGGYGSAKATCDDCEGDREGAGAGYLKMGFTLNERLLLGGEFNLWTKSEDDVTLNLYNATATLTFYPKAESGFFLKGGVGASFVDTEFDDGDITADLGSGLGLLAGVGYDWRLGRNVSVTPAFNYWYGSPGDLVIGGETLATNWKQNVFDITIGVTFH